MPRGLSTSALLSAVTHALLTITPGQILAVLMTMHGQAWAQFTDLVRKISPNTLLGTGPGMYMCPVYMCRDLRLVV